MRLFTGISIGPAVLEPLARLLTQLSSEAPLKWSPPENLHITTKFIGQWPDERVPEMVGTLAAIPYSHVFPLNLSGLEFLPGHNRPRTLIARVQPGPELSALVSSIEEALVTIGCPREERKYTPHVTLARVKNEDIRRLRERIAAMTDLNLGSFEVTHFHLYLSKPTPRGSVYTVLESFPLAAEASV